MEKELEKYLSSRKVFYYPNFCTKFQISLSDAKTLLEKLVIQGRIKKVFVPKFYSAEDGRDIFLEEHCSQEKVVTDEIKKTIEDYYCEMQYIDGIDWAEGYQVVK